VEESKLPRYSQVEKILANGITRFAANEFPNNVSGDNEGLRALLVDGLHLTGEGYKLFLNQVLPLVGPNWSIEAPEDPSWIFP